MDALQTITRRLFLKSAPVAAAAVALPAAGAIAAQGSQSAMDRLDAAIDALKLAMADVYGADPEECSKVLPHQGVVVLSVLAEPSDRVKWFIDDGVPITYSGPLPERSAKPVRTGSPKPSMIEALYREWKAIRDGDFSADTNDAAEMHHARYVDLQAAITAMTPTSARDVAIQFTVETDEGDSDYRDAFALVMAQMAAGAA